MTPQQFLATRFSALQQGDYKAVFHSYHPDSPFRQQFSGVASYGQFAAEHLAHISVKAWQCLDMRWPSESEVECILLMQVQAAATITEYYELALLISTSEGWRYHSAQKLSSDEVPVGKSIDFIDFDAAQNQVRF